MEGVLRERERERAEGLCFLRGFGEERERNFGGQRTGRKRRRKLGEGENRKGWVGGIERDGELNCEKIFLEGGRF